MHESTLLKNWEWKWTWRSKIHGPIFVFTTSIRMGWSAKDRGSQHGLATGDTGMTVPADAALAAVVRHDCVVVVAALIAIIALS
jgi:hypothetical protein